jgi:primary-amine oxidase
VQQRATFNQVPSLKMHLYIFSGLAWSSLTLASTLPLPPLGYERRLLQEAFDKRGYNVTAPASFSEAAPTTKVPKTNIWSPISADDNPAVWNLLHDPVSGLNLTLTDDAVLTDNYVYLILQTTHLTSY